MTPIFGQANDPGLCYTVVPMMDRQQIADLRKRTGWTQAEMASALGIANRLTISQWEIGASSPGGPAMRLLRFLASLSSAELKRVTQRLVDIGTEDCSALPRKPKKS